MRVDTSTASGKLMLQMVTAFAEFEVQVQSDRRKLRAKHLKDNGYVTLGADEYFRVLVGAVPPPSPSPSSESPQARATHLAAGPTPIDIAELLIDHGAEVDAKSAAGVTALMVAAGHNNAPMIGLLLGKGANPTLKNNVGKTALDIARDARNEVAVSALQLLAIPPPN